MFREPRVKDDGFLRRLRLLPCIVPRCSCKAEAAHVGMTDGRHGVVESGQAKPHDFYCLPCCALHHREGDGAEHRVGTENFWRRLGIDPFPLAASLYAIHASTDDDIAALAKMRLVVLEARFAADL